MKLLATEKIGPKQSLTPEGFLLCEAVPVARTGVLYYGPGETPIEPGQDGVVRILREEGEVFRPEFLLSIAAKPVVNNHPDEDVNPDNYKALTCGVTLNPRRGTGVDGAGNALDQFIVADLLICEKQAIEDVQSGKREVSMGYEAEYDETAPGVGRQYNMKCNHIALVDAGRCGQRCSISDAQSTVTGDQMKVRDDTTRMTVRDRIAALAIRITEASKAKDQKTLDEATAELSALSRTMDEGGEELHLHLGGQGGQARGMSDDDIEARFAGIEQGMGGITDALSAITEKLGGGGGNDTVAGGASDAEPTAEEKEKTENMKDEFPEEKAEEAAKAKDSAFFSDSFQETVAIAEILVPGIQVPQFDTKSTPAKTYDAICALRRRSLEISFSTVDGRAAIEQVNGGKAPDLSKLKPRDVRSLFRGAGAVRKAQNNAAVSAATHDRSTERQTVGAPVSIADYNERNRARYARKSA